MAAAWRSGGRAEMWLASVLGYGWPHRLERDLRHDARPAAGPAGYVERPVDRVDAVDEAAQTRATRRIRAADSIIHDLGHEAAPLPPHAHGGGARVGVLCDVCERLGDHVERRDLDRLRQPLLDLDVELDRNRRALGEGRERGTEAAVREHRRV